MTNPSQEQALAAAAARLGLAAAPVETAAATQEETATANAQASQGVQGLPQGMSMPEMLAQMQQLVDLNAKMAAALSAANIKLDAPQEPRKMKIYYHRIPNSTIVVVRKGPGGENIPEVHTFYGGQLATDDPVLQDFLDPITDRPDTPVFTRDLRNSPDPQALALASEVIQNAARTIDKLGAEARPQV